MDSEFNDWELLHDSPESETKQSRELHSIIQSDYFSINSGKTRDEKSAESDRNVSSELQSDSVRGWCDGGRVCGFEVKEELGFVGNEELRHGSGKFDTFDVENKLGFVNKGEDLVNFGGVKEFESKGEADGELRYDSVGDRCSLGKVEGSVEVSGKVTVVSDGLGKSGIVSSAFDGKSGLDRVFEKNEIISSAADSKNDTDRFSHNNESETVLSESDGEPESGLYCVSKKSEIFSSEFDGKSGSDQEKSEIVLSESDGKSVSHLVTEKGEIVSSESDGRSVSHLVTEKSEIVSRESDGNSVPDGVTENSDFVSSEFDGKSGSDGGMEDESVKSDEGGDTGDKEIQGKVEKRRVVWWKVPLDFLRYCVFKFNPVFSVSVAATLMGIVIMGRRMYKMKRKSRLLELKLMVDDKEVSQFRRRAAQLNEAFSVVRRVPGIRPSLPASGVTPWPAMNLR